MKSFFSSIFGLFLSPLGVLFLGALDSSMLFFLPAAIDTAVIVMSARNREIFWIYPILATLGSLAGAAVTFAFGHKIGEKGLARWIPERRLKKIRRKVDEKGVVAFGMTAVLPPPFPLTPFVITSGALGLNKKKFFLTLGAMRFLRFGAESLLALAYGPRIVRWLNEDAFQYIISILMVIALAGTAVSITQVIRKSR